METIFGKKFFYIIFNIISEIWVLIKQSLPLRQGCMGENSCLLWFVQLHKCELIRLQEQSRFRVPFHKNFLFQGQDHLFVASAIKKPEEEEEAQPAARYRRRALAEDEA